MKLLKKIVLEFHKYFVPVLFCLNVVFMLCAYTDWYFNYYNHLKHLLNIGVLPCVMLIIEGWYRGKCSWFLWSAIGVLLDSLINYFDYIFKIDYNIYYLLFAVSIQLVIFIKVIGLMLKEYQSLRWLLIIITELLVFGWIDSYYGWNIPVALFSCFIFLCSLCAFGYYSIRNFNGFIEQKKDL